MSGPVRHLAEIVLWVNDMDDALRFYRDLLGLELISPPDFPVRFLKAGPGEGPIPEMLVLVQHPDTEYTFPRSKAERTLHHLAFNIGADGYDLLERRCRETGLDVRTGVHPVLKGVRTFYIDDPDGNEVEIMAPEPGQ